MLKITIPSVELYNEEINEFTYSNEQTLQLEHSLVSISKWESKWKKPFLTKEEKTVEETIDYIKCMTTTSNVDHAVYEHVTNENMQKVRDYIDDSMTATTFANDKKSINREVITSEIIYFWMITLNIPFECQKWHLNRLLTLIKVCDVKNTPPKKMNKKELIQRNSAINAARRNKLNSGG